MHWAVPPPVAAAAAPSPEPLAANGTAVTGSTEMAHQGRIAALLHPFSNTVANTKLLALCSGVLGGAPCLLISRLQADRLVRLFRHRSTG